MPNWCNNNITISGNEGTIKALTAVLKNLKDNDDVFKSLIGIPSYMSEGDYKEKWYDTNVNWFGTKWDISYDRHAFTLNKDEITFHCETAWSPPIPFMENLCKMYQVNGHIYYSEGGIGFTGETTFTWQDGELDVFDQEFGFLEGMYILSKDEFWSEVDYSLDNISDEDQSLEDFLNQYMFVSYEDKKELTRLYNETKESNVESESE
jgi:hypothetical protein